MVPASLAVRAPEMGMRSARELETLSEVLDRSASNLPRRGADKIAQRVQAIELMLADSGWDRAQHLELIAPKSTDEQSREAARVPRRSRRTRSRSGKRKRRRGFTRKPTEFPGDVQGRRVMDERTTKVLKSKGGRRTQSPSCWQERRRCPS